MLVSTLLDRINYALRGLDDTAPSIGTDEANFWLSIANAKKDEWATDPKNSWRSLFEKRTITPVVAGVNTYDLPDDFIRPSDCLYVGTNYKFEFVEPELRDSYVYKVFISGQNPKVLDFNGQITATTPYIGESIILAGYYLPDDMTLATDTVPVDDPDWLALAVAAEAAFSDTSYEDKAPDILGKANALYEGMADANRKLSTTTPRKAHTQVTRIRGV